MLWLAIALMTIAALGLLAWPFLRRKPAVAAREAYDLAVYRDQLKELEQDLARGVVNESEAGAARLEIQRRMLRLAPAGATSSTPTSEAAEQPARRRLVSYLPLGALGLAVPALAIGLYATLGSPHLPSRPFAETQQEAALQGQTIEAAITGLKERLAKQPRDTEGWLLLGRSYIFLQRYADAVTALKQAAAIEGGKPAINAMLAEALVFEAGGQITADARALFTSVREAEPKNTAALYYLGLSEAQSSRPKEALALWEELAAVTPGNAPWRDDLVAAMKQVAAQLGVEPKVLPPLPEAPPATAEAAPQSTAPGPSEEEMAAAAEMSPEDRQEMIRSMVERLADRLKENPDDLTGWRRLANAYRVLGDEAKAKEAEAEIARLEAKGSAQPQPAPSSDAAPGPTQEEMQAAAEMSPDEQNAMIRSMVEGLAKRLETAPDDLEGWKRLGMSYRVLGEHAKAATAFERAAALAPDDAAVQADYARAILDAAPAGDPIPTASIERYRRVLVLDPNNMDALWFVGYAEATAATPNREAAKAHWQKLLGLLKPGTDSYISVENALKALAEPS